jgi:hypothetical protein
MRCAKGIFTITSLDSAMINSQALHQPFVDGAYLRHHAATVNPGPGYYNWSALDSEIAQVEAASKVWSVSVSWGRHTPSWVRAAGCQGFDYIDASDGTTCWLPLPWDPVYLSALSAFHRALAVRYASRASLVQVTANLCCSTDDENILPYDQTSVKNWQAAGYKRGLIVQNFLAKLGELAGLFPGVQVRSTHNIGSLPPLDDSGALIPWRSFDLWGVQQMVSGAINALGSVFAPCNNGLSATWYSPLVAALARPATQVGYQATWFVTGDATYRANGGKPDQVETILQNMVAHGEAGKASWLEMYVSDLVNPACAAIWQQAHAQLAGA